jgi:hypothetical protein
MLDPREQKKSGFGAFVAREHERQELRDARSAVLGPDQAVAPAKDAGDAPPSGAVSAADGASSDAPAR